MPNHLTNATSPYLLQHADNPVDWYPWSDEALALARREGRPILLSIGYSACHWCHVMAHESFADAGVAALMNRLFVNIKVDREERPDLDHIYQLAHQLLQQRAGGWPLTMFLTPDGTPFFGGTYFPPTPRYGLPGFAELLQRVAAAHAERRGDIDAQGAALRQALVREAAGPGGAAAGTRLDRAPIEVALGLLARHFDTRWGGFGEAPKFPHPTDLALLLRDADAQRRGMALTTLRRMADGGINDQLDGGFYRYSVDARWEIPHFEKMLYDNAQLLRLYADAWACDGDERWREVVERTAAWVMREMQSSSGGYWSSLDADSEGEEGRYYVWSAAAVATLLDPGEYEVAAACFGLDDAPNFEERAWHLRRVRSPAEVAERLGLAPDVAAARLAAASAKLLAARRRRQPPGRDEKVLTSWNALMIEAMAHAGRIFRRADWLRSAERALDFVRATLWVDGRLLATARDGQAHLNAYLDDHAFLLAAVLEMLQARFRAEDLEFAQALAAALLERFEAGAAEGDADEDAPAGGFLLTSHDHETLLFRPRPAHDNALPSGNGVAAQALLRLAAISGEPRYAAAAERTLRAFWPQLSTRPGGCAALLLALDDHCRPPGLVVLRGPAAELGAWEEALRARLPSLLLFPLPPATAGLPAALDKPVAERTQAWVCVGPRCLPPVETPQQLLRLLATDLAA